MIKKVHLEIILVSVFLFIFLFVHSDLLLFNKYRSSSDTFAAYSQFYYALNSLRNGTLPLWDPYTHCGQPFYYHFTKILWGELGVLFFSLISMIFNGSILKLYNYHYTFHFLIFVFGCFYLARIIFQRRVISYYILILCLFSVHYNLILGSDGAILGLEFLPWLMAIFVIFAKGKARSYHLFAFVIIFLFFTLSMDFAVYFYFLFLFCIFYYIVFRRQLSWSKIHWEVWVFAASILCLGLFRGAVLFSEANNIFPSLRFFISPSKISNGINIASPLDQVYPARIRGYFTILNPLIGRYGGTETKFYLGFFPVFFAFYAVALRRNKLIWTLAFPAILSLWISLGPSALLSSLCFYTLPFFKSIRQMSLFSFAPVFISFVFVSAVGFKDILEKIDHLQDFRRFWKHIQKYLWFFTIAGLIITIAYILHDWEGYIKRLLTLSYYFLPMIGIILCYWINKKLQRFQKIDILVVRTIFLFSAVLFLIIALAIFSRPFFVERLMYFEINRLILMLAAFCVIISCSLFFYNKKHSAVIAVICLGITFIDLVFFTSLSIYTRLERREGLVIPESVKSFEYQKFRLESYWPSNLKKVNYLRPAMLYLKSSVITEEKFYYQGSLIFEKNREYDFYMLKKFWEAYTRFPEGVKKVIMGVDMPKLAFFADYKVMDDESVFKECENLNPELLKHYVYLAPNSHETLPIHQTSTGKTLSADIEVEHFDNNNLRLAIDAKEDGLLYYSDGYDKNWRCLVDGKQWPIHRANIAFKAVFIPEGRHSVSFEYKPILYMISFWLFLAACVMGFISICWSWSRRKRSDKER